MTDRSKFEQMLEYLISDEQDKAKELFHQLVVEKSREIYEEILEEDFSEEVDEAKDEDEKVEEADDAEDEGEKVEEASDEDVEENFGVEEGGDATDDFIDDIEAGDDEEGDDMGGEGDIEDRVVDLEDALDELKAEFEKMMSGEEEPEMGGDDMGDMGGDDMGDMGDDKPVKDSFDVSDNFMREYIEKVSAPKHGDDGANTKSPVAGKNDMGGTTANIAKGGEAKGEGTKGGLANPSTKEDNAGNVNVPGAKKAATLNKVATPKGGDNGANTKSTIGA